MPCPAAPGPVCALPQGRHVGTDVVLPLQAEAPFVPSLENKEDVSYFVPKHPTGNLNSMAASSGGMPSPSTNLRRNLSENTIAGDDERDTDYLNFSYHNLIPLYERNLDELEAARAWSGGSGDTSGRDRERNQGTAQRMA